MLIITIVVAVRANVHKQLCVHLCQNENRPAFVFVSPQILHAGIEMYSNNPYILWQPHSSVPCALWLPLPSTIECTCLY